MIIEMPGDLGRTVLNCYDNVKMETAQKLVFECKGDASESLMLLPEALQPHVQVQGF